jgi:chemotaxis protein MotB
LRSDLNLDKSTSRNVIFSPHAALAAGNRIMKAARLVWLVSFVAAAPLLAGCMVPQTQLTAAQTQNHVLTLQNQAQLAEIENLKHHTADVQEQLARAEHDLAQLQEQSQLDQARLTNFRHERDELHEQFKGVANAKVLPPGVSKQLTDLAARYPNLHYDPATGVAKLDTDVLFDSGQIELKPAAQALLGELSHVLETPEAGQLRVMVVGHTDNQRIVGVAAGEHFSNNFHLSTGRALAVADLLRRQGLSERRIGVAGFGPYQPVATNDSAGQRQKNRRVEIFVMTPDVPVVGWSDSLPSVY